MATPYHKRNYITGYELAAINLKTEERIFVGIIRGSKSRGTLRKSIFTELNNGDTRLDRINKLTGQASGDWNWNKKSSEGISAGDWTVRFSGRTALEVDQNGTGRSIYDDEAKVKQ